MSDKDNPFGSTPSDNPFGSTPSDNPFGSTPSDDPFGSSPSDDPFGGESARPGSGDPSGPAPSGDQPSAAPPNQAWRSTTRLSDYGPDASGHWSPGSPGFPPMWIPDAPAPGTGSPRADGAIPALVLGVVGLVFCPIFAPFAWVLGRKAERAVDASGGSLAGRGEATAGKVLGIVATVLWGLGILLLILLLVIGLAVSDPGSGGALTVEGF